MSALAARFLLRLGLLATVAGAFLYAALVLVVWPQPAALERVASRIVMGDRYRPEEIELLASAIAEIAAAPVARAASLRASAIVALRQAEEAIAEGRRADIDTNMEALARLLSGALARAPGDAFLWLALFWRDNTAEGFAPARLQRLAMSYATGPNEGWVGVKRSVVALALWAHLTPIQKAAAAREFVGLVSDFRSTEISAAILVGPGWSARQVLLSQLVGVREARRKAFSRALDRVGVDVEIPGIERTDPRPWFR